MDFSTILSGIDNKQEPMLRFLEQLVNIDSGSDNPTGIAQVAHLVGEKLSALGFIVEYLDQPDVCTHVLAKKAGTGNKEVMIIGHMDTVFPVGTVSKRPFSWDNCKAYGPGVLDMKGGIAAALFALESMFENGWKDKNLTVFFCGDEETGHPRSNAAELFLQLGRGKNAVFNMESGRPDGSVIIGRKGGCQPNLFVKGIAAHAGNEPEKGASATLELAHKTVEIHALTNFKTGTTFNVGVVEGGIAPNVVADSALARIDIRFTTLEECDKALANLREIAERTHVPGTTASLENCRILFMPMQTTETVSELYELVRTQAGRLGISAISGQVSGGGSDSALTVMAGSPTICAMGPRGGLNHSEREYIFLDGLTERSKLLALCIDAV